MKMRKIVSTVLIAAMLFFAPSMIPAKAIPIPCGVHPAWLATDTAFAAPPIIPCPVPGPGHGFIPGWFWAAFACPASIIRGRAVCYTGLACRRSNKYRGTINSAAGSGERAC
jgi:hypothetical protein